MQIFTPTHIQLLKNLSGNGPISQFHKVLNPNQLSLPEYPEDGPGDKVLFQILTIGEIPTCCEEKWDKKNSKKKRDKKNIVYGTKKDLMTYYNIKDNELPTKGAEVHPNFVKENDPSYTAIRFLLQCRQLSQMISYTWLDCDNLQEEELKEGTDSQEKVTNREINLVRQILNSYNIIPDSYFLYYDPMNNPQFTHLNHINDVLELINKIENKIQAYDFHYFIHPLSISYSAISLALLLSGQAYYQKEGKWKIIYKSILSTYETIWEYALGISWDTFYATREDLSQAIKLQRPPFTQVTLGYPPRPSKFQLSQEQIKSWAEASEVGGDFPFYSTNEDKKNKLDCVAPPYPYIPLSTT